MEHMRLRVLDAVLMPAFASPFPRSNFTSSAISFPKRFVDILSYRSAEAYLTLPYTSVPTLVLSEPFGASLRLNSQH